MNNSLDRLIDGMVATLRQEVIPHVGTEFARGQAFGVIYMLKSLQLRAAWSPAFFSSQLVAQNQLAEALKPLLADANAPKLPQPAEGQTDTAALEALRDGNDGRIAALIEWHGHAAQTMEPSRAEAIEAVFRTYMDFQLKHELQTSARPMFAEMSSGSE